MSEELVLKPLVDAWVEKIEQAKRVKKDFDNIAKECDAFFSKSCGFMWESAFRSKYIGRDLAPPKFQVTIAKAFELVALFGPTLYWQYPHRAVRSEKPLEFRPELFSDPRIAPYVGARLGVPGYPGSPEYAQQVQQAVAQATMTQEAAQDARNSLMERYLNYSQREQPGGGLAMHSELSITEALVKGRGLLWAETYKFPGSGRTLTGSFHDSVDNFYIDPDCIDPTLTDAKWIARRHVMPVWQVEKLFDYPKGYFKNRGQFETSESLAVRNSNTDKVHRANGQTYDQMVWYEIWSKGGVGTRLDVANEEIARVNKGLSQALDEVVGDYAYLCVTPSVPFPLNAPWQKFTGAEDEDIQEIFEWRAANYGDPFPCYLDDRWPVAVLDFYRKYGSAWPIAPLAPALGEMIALNVLTSSFLEQAYENRKQIIAYLGSAAKDVEDAIRGSSNPAFVEINDAAHNNINQIIQYLNRPEMNKDMITAIQYVSDLFDKRTGLTEIMYAMNVGGAASRTARDVAAKEEKASIRPDKMSKDVARWQSEAADLDKFLARWSVESGDIRPLLGEFGALMWDALITSQDPEVVVREMRATVQASDTRKPNKEREATNMQQILGYTLPILQQYAQDTGDSAPVNEFLKTLGDSIQQDTSGWVLGQWMPQPDMQAAQQEEAMAKLELARMEADVLLKKMDLQGKKIDQEGKQVDVAGKNAQLISDIKHRQLEFNFDSLEHQQDLVQDQEKHEQELSQDQESHLLKLIQDREAGAQKIQQMRMESRAKPKSSSAT